MTQYEYKRETQRQMDTDPCPAETDNDRVGSESFYSAVRAHRYQVYAPWFDEVVRFGDWNGKDVLEIGVGLGSDHFRFASSGARVTSVDLSGEHLRHAQRHLTLNRLHSRPTFGDAESLPFRDSSFDLVYAFGVLHHTPNIDGAVAEVWRVLRPGGTAIVGLYHRDSIFLLQTVILQGIMKLGLIRKGWRRLLADIEYHSERNEAVPLVNVYTRTFVRKLFSRFGSVSVSSCHVEKWHFSKLHFLLARIRRSTLERMFGRYGWYLIVRATK